MRKHITKTYAHTLVVDVFLAHVVGAHSHDFDESRGFVPFLFRVRIRAEDAFQVFKNKVHCQFTG